MLCCADLEGQMTLGNLGDSHLLPCGYPKPARKTERASAGAF